MTAIVQTLGDNTSRECKPDFNTGKGWAWEKMTKEAIQAGTVDRFPRKPRKGLAEESYWGAVDRHLSRRTFIMGVTFKDGRIVREENNEDI